MVRFIACAPLELRNALSISSIATSRTGLSPLSMRNMSSGRGRAASPRCEGCIQGPSGWPGSVLFLMGNPSSSGRRLLRIAMRVAHVSPLARTVVGSATVFDTWRHAPALAATSAVVGGTNSVPSAGVRVLLSHAKNLRSCAKRKDHRASPAHAAARSALLGQGSFREKILSERDATAAALHVGGRQGADATIDRGPVSGNRHNVAA